MAVSLDPLFFYIPKVNRDKQCVDLESKLEITASVLRSFTDIFYILHIIFQFQTGFIAPPSRVFGRGVLVEDLSAIARRYVSSYFFIDILAVLPLPQVHIHISGACVIFMVCGPCLMHVADLAILKLKVISCSKCWSFLFNFNSFLGMQEYWRFTWIFLVLLLKTSLLLNS